MPIQPANILVVDDEPGPRESLRVVLQEDHNVTCVSDGPRALHLVRTRPVDLVTLDLRLPGLEGLDLLREIKALDPHIEVIVVTGYGDLQSAMESIHQGVADYLTKPFNINEIKRAVSKSLERRRLNLELTRFFRELEAAEGTPAALAEGRAQEANLSKVLMADSLQDLLSLRKQMIRTERLSTVGLMTAGFIHEINNPLASVTALAELSLAKLREPRPPLAQVELSLQKIFGETKRISRLAARMLGLAREHSGAGGPAETADLIEEVLELIRPQLSRKAIRLEWRRPPGRTAALCDADNVKQVLLNLLINAVQATPEGGKVTVGMRLSKSAVRVKVADTGCGITPEHLPRIFDPFFTTKSEGDGTGLGLYICRQIVKRCGGSLEVSTSPGRGATFTLSLPIG